MTSKIKAKIDENISLHRLFSSLFPSGSVTGAPKIRTMQIIKELEKEERKVYTGAIGFIAPNRDMVFNIAIRTILLNGSRGELGVGSGIVYDSDPAKEYEESRLKADFLTKKIPAFELIETILFDKNKYYLLKGHVERLEQSAKYFDFKTSKKEALKALKIFAKKLDADKKCRVRILSDKNGKIKISYSAIEESDLKETPKIAAFSKKTTLSSDVFLFHKTTNRALYDEEYKKYQKKGFYDVIFENEKDEVTEGSISNIFIKKGNKIYTPPVECGLLNGIYRQYFIKNNRIVEEKILKKKDVLEADRVYLCNSVRGLVPVEVTGRTRL
jgi:para-aminobenzoate synthetase/4-amino-4-deoxychorismate lyase